MCLRKQNQWNVTFVKFHQKDKLGSSTMSHLYLPRLGLCSFWVLKCFIHPKNLSTTRISNQNPYTIKLRIEFSKTKKSQSNKIAERERVPGLFEDLNEQTGVKQKEEVAMWWSFWSSLCFEIRGLINLSMSSTQTEGVLIVGGDECKQNRIRLFLSPYTVVQSLLLMTIMPLLRGPRFHKETRSLL